MFLKPTPFPVTEPSQAASFLFNLCFLFHFFNLLLKTEAASQKLNLESLPPFFQLRISRSINSFTVFVSSSIFLFFFFSSSGAARISQDLRRGSTAEESWSAAALLEQDLVRRSFGWGSVDDDSMPERRSVRQDAQKPVMGITLLLQTSLQLLILKFTSPHKSLARLLEQYQGVEEKLLD
ncbi:hypothetical protein P8452_69341 [Trifolium repens]|nr:protein OCTOPUS [Trifolium repens]WJX87115.1 hypothetical protein P8452_69341 [Trifolium repens]